jgi:poly-gamma-glutamate synthesis protein (capsule biosynthesis protein)
LGDSGVKYFGDPNNIQNFLSVTTSYNNITFGFVGYHQLIEKGFEDIIAETKKLDTEVDVLIAMPHWGIEYAADTPSYLQKKEAHEMIDAGVDLIIGAHPHVVEPIEIYKEKVIFYSLGNFIFDQYFSEETMTGLAVGMKIEKDDTEKLNITYSLIPLDISKQSQASVAESPKKEKVLNHLYKFSQVDDLVKDAIKDGEFENHYSLRQ